MTETNETLTTGSEDTETDTDTSKTYTEAEVLDLVQKATDKRVTEALKKQEHKLNQKLAESDKLRGMDEEQRKAYEFEQKLAEFEVEKKEFTRAQNLLEANKILANRGLPINFSNYIVADDAETMMENITTFETLFKAAVNDAVSIKIASPTPKSGATGQVGLTRESFIKMSALEQGELYKTNPELYKTLVGA
jgi:hypothetical protein